MTSEQLPAFLRRAKDGRLEMVLHCTWVQDYNVCPRKFWLRYGEQVQATGPRPALNYGGAVHAAMAYRYRAAMAGQDDDRVEPAQMEILSRWFEEQPAGEGEWRNCGRAQDLIRAYNEANPVLPFTVLAVEEEFEVGVGAISNYHVAIDSKCVPYVGGSDKPVNVILAGRKDAVVAWHNGLWVVDHKTASDWGAGDSNSHLDEGRRSFQFRGYAWAEREKQRLIANDPHIAAEGETDLGPRDRLPLLGTTGNYLISRKPYADGYKPKGNAAPRNQFHVECFPYEPSVLDEWRDECLDVAAAILRDWERGRWRTNDSGCGHWGRCEFYDYCEEAPDRRGDLLASSLFEPKVVTPCEL